MQDAVKYPTRWRAGEPNRRFSRYSRSPTAFRNPPISRKPSHPTRRTRVRTNPRTTFVGPFGEVIKQTGLASACPFGFSTKYRDGETGLIYYGYRYFGKYGWISRDVIEEDGGENLYEYALNSPVEWIDALGLKIRVDGSEEVVKIVLDALGTFIRGKLSADRNGYINREPNPKDCKKCPKDQDIERWVDVILASADEYIINVTDHAHPYGADGSFQGNSFGNGGVIRVKPNPNEFYDANGGTWTDLWRNYECYTFSSVLALELLGRAYLHCTRESGMDQQYGDLDRYTKDKLNDLAVRLTNEALIRLGKNTRKSY